MRRIGPGTDVTRATAFNCVPTYNRAWLLERNITFHLAAFRALELAIEIVIVDDCSTDGTADYLDRIAGTPQLAIYTRHKNSGFLDNYAFAMRRAKGRYAVFLGDDDLLIPNQVVDYIQRLEEDPALGMIQAPWMEVDERPGGGDMNPFYRIPREIRIEKGDHTRLGDAILHYHIFPEFMIVRRDVLARSISAACPFIFWAFLFTGRALAHGAILFAPTPFARVTALSDDPRLRQGNKETMMMWDHYRGGIEYIVALALRGSPVALEERMSSTIAINHFMSIREKVALRLLVHAKQWVEAYILVNRITAYEPLCITPQQLSEISQMAGLTCAARDAANYSNAPGIVDPQIDDRLLAALDPAIQGHLIRQTSVDVNAETPNAYLRIDPSFPKRLGAKDALFDVRDYMAQFV